MFKTIRYPWQSGENPRWALFLKLLEKRHITFSGSSIRLTVDISIEMIEDRRKWNDIFKMLAVWGGGGAVSAKENVLVEYIQL